MLNLFGRPKILLDENIIEWIFTCYGWALNQFDSNVFYHEAILVVPDNAHFPGREQSMEGMADLIFNQVKNYAGMNHWPTRLFNQEEAACQPPASQPVHINGALRGKNAVVEVANEKSEKNALPFIYHPQQIKNPEGLIAHFAHGLSHLLASTAKQLPPGGQDYWPMASELTGIFLGFGLMFTNSAGVRRSGGCGGCGGGPVRQVFLNEEEATYALAVFCVLKNIEAKAVTRHLKKHLRGLLKSAMKDCEQRMGQYPHLKLQLESPVSSNI